MIRFHTEWLILASLVLCAVHGDSLVFGQERKSGSGSTGYLNRSGPALRFAAPPKPTVPNLPPSGISDATVPVFGTEFRAGPDAPVIKQPAKNGVIKSDMRPQAPVTTNLTFKTLAKYFSTNGMPVTNRTALKFDVPMVESKGENGERKATGNGAVPRGVPGGVSGAAFGAGQ